jgi:four helix bundle protein
MTVKDYKDLLIWQKGIEIVDKVYGLTEHLPSSEQFQLISQMRRAAVSIPSNIAEGFVRRNPKEYRQFLYISLGSCAELDTQFIVTERRKYLQPPVTTQILDDINHEMRMLRSLILKL